MKNFVIVFSAILFVTSCSKNTEEVAPVIPVEIRTVEIQRLAPIVPNIDQLSLRSIHWVILTPENINEKFAQMQSGELVLFGLTSSDYENLSLNLSDLRAMIEQQQSVIAIYKRQF